MIYSNLALRCQIKHDLEVDYNMLTLCFIHSTFLITNYVASILLHVEVKNMNEIFPSTTNSHF